jgi:integrase
MNTVAPHPTGARVTSERQLRPDQPRPQLGDFTEARPRRKAREVRSDDGRVTVKYWQSRWRDKKRRRIYTKWYFTCPTGAGVCTREAHSTESITKARAKEVANSIANGQVSLLSFTQAKKASCLRAEELLRPTGKSIELCAAEYGEAYTILRAGLGELPAGVLATAARDYVAQHALRATSKNCPDVLAELLLKRKADGAAQNTLDDLESRLGRFVRDFTGPVPMVTAQSINAWLRGLDVSRRTRNNYRGALVAFYRYAKECHYVPKNWSVLEDVPRAKDEPILIVPFKAAEFRKILVAREDAEADWAAIGRRYKTLIPFLAVGALAGLRHEEMCAGKDPRGKPLPVLDWAQVNLKRKTIRVLEQVARKIGRSRTVPMCDALVTLLTPYARTCGPICELSNANNACQTAAADAGVVWKRNGMRKGFITNRLEILKDIGKVAIEAGTSPERINKNYKAPVEAFHPGDVDPAQTDDEAVAWFQLRSGRADVLPLFAWGKRTAN